MNRYQPPHVDQKAKMSFIYLLLFVGFVTFAVGIYRGGVHLAHLEAQNITLKELPSALILSTLRMSISFIASLIFSFGLGLLAARTRWGEKVIIPLLDILQSVPVVGFFPAATTFFISLLNGHRIGIELAAIFLIFTSQAWNMAFAVYESVKGIPQDQINAIDSFGIRGSRRFWLLFGPASIPRLIYNSILSWSNGWFFLVACEIIAEGPIRYHLPGIGSFLARAAEQDQVNLVIYGLIALCSLIFFLDIFIWRPTSLWASRFKQDQTSENLSDTGTFQNLPQTLFSKIEFLEEPAKQLLSVLFFPILWVFKEIFLPLFWDLPAAILRGAWIEVYSQFALPALARWDSFKRKFSRFLRWFYLCIGFLFFGYCISLLIHWFSPPYPPLLFELPLAILNSTARLLIALLLSLAWTVPVVLFTWNRPKLRQALTTFAQLGAGIPAIALFPLIIVLAVKRMGGGMEFASVLLLMTGMQWYILFNLLGGAATIPNQLKIATKSLGLSRTLVWKKLVLPATRPAMITGALTAWGGGWNALVVAEYVTFKDEVLKVNGIGALLNHSVYTLNDGRAITLCIATMVGWILLINLFIWKPIYESSIERYKLES